MGRHFTRLILSRHRRSVFSMLKLSPAKRRYNTDLLVYEAFYVSLRNALIVALAPLGVLLFLSAVEEFRMTEKFFSTLVTMTEIVFVIGFFINFLYYVYFIRIRRLYAFLLSIAISCGIAVLIFFSDLEKVLSDSEQAILLAAWFLLLAVIITVNKIGHWPDKDSRYENESWLYRHELAETRTEEKDHDPEDGYMHRYVERPTGESDPEPDATA